MNLLDGERESNYRDVIWWDGTGELDVYVVVCENTMRLFRDFADAIDFACPYCAISHMEDM